MEFHYKDEHVDINFNKEYINFLLNYFKSVYFSGGIIIVEYDDYKGSNFGNTDYSKYIIGKPYLVETFDMLGNHVKYCCLLKDKSDIVLEFVRINTNIKSMITSFTVNPNIILNRILPLFEEDLDSMYMF